jgi:hypothetical protein
MNLEGLGIDDWFRERAVGTCAPRRAIVRATAVDRDRYLVAGEHGEV